LVQIFYSVFWRDLLRDRKGIRPVKETMPLNPKALPEQVKEENQWWQEPANAGLPGNCR